MTAIKNTFDSIIQREKTIVYVLLACILSLGVLYGLLVRATILNVIAREDTQKSINELTSRIGDLESQYIALKNTITLDMAYSKGFVDAQNTTFITRSSLGKHTLSRNIE